MQLSDFSSLYELSVGFIAVSAVIGDMEKHAVEKVESISSEIYDLKAQFKTTDSVMDNVDEELNILDPQIAFAKDDLAQTMRGLRIVTWSGVSIPVTLLYMGAYGNANTGYFFVNATLLICYSWGPITLWIGQQILKRRLREIEKHLTKIRRMIITNSVAVP
ncbi:hypothetical protein HFO15_05535 [Rhizobium laguerreae]|uniref:hypothetical protein n=1 Tax=Rhizobium laguerreae TaxID=1076926 RepID=UPI001C900DB9|nr:hypothetical protein [Rhizobium laguerreae]MBY3261124.1 hypothetical protein [Rhizobium laguerreae]MBY3336432.1 hypothetical protein [Rhizobium laguerreae]